MSATYEIQGGMFDGWTLRSSRRGRAQISADHAPSRPAPLNVLARRYLSDSPVWQWLRERGIERPDVVLGGPSGPSGRHRTDERARVDVWLPHALVARAREVAAASGRDLRTVVEDAVREHVVKESERSQ